MILEKYKQEVINTARAMLEWGLVTDSWGNVSMRLPGEAIFLITPSGMGYGELNNPDLVAMDISGSVIQGQRKPSSEFRLHCELYRTREDVGAVVHTHSIYASVFAAARLPIPVVMEELAQVNGGAVPVAEYRIPGSSELASGCTRTLGQGNAVLLANHGLVGVAPHLGDALKVCRIVERTARIALGAMSLGPLRAISAEDIATIRNYYLKEYGQK